MDIPHVEQLDIMSCFLFNPVCLLLSIAAIQSLLLCSEKKQWLVQRMENRQKATKQEQLAILRGLVDADAIERFLASKFPASKVCTTYTASIWCKQALCMSCLLQSCTCTSR